MVESECPSARSSSSQAVIRHVELSLDPAPRLVIQFAIAEELVDPLPLCGNEQAFNFVVERTVFFGSSLARTAVGNVLQTSWCWVRAASILGTTYDALLRQLIPADILVQRHRW
jgi:hypothetical protein